MSKYDLFFGLLEDIVKENFSPLFDTLISSLGEENIDYGISRTENYFPLTINTDVVRKFLNGDLSKIEDLLTDRKSTINNYSEDDLKDITTLLKIYLGLLPIPWENPPFGFSSFAKRYVKIFKDFLYISPCIRFNETTITNENKLSTKVNDLFMNFGLNIDGSIRTYPSLTKTTYKLSEAMIGYIHSHVPRLRLHNSGNAISSSNIIFESCCLGRGPLASFYEYKNKAKTIDIENNVRINAELMMFANNLMEYVKIESLKGGPYIRMSGLKNAFGGEQMHRTFDYYKRIKRNVSVFDLIVDNYDAREFPNLENASSNFHLTIRYIMHSFLHSLLENPEFEYQFINNFVLISSSDNNFCTDLTQRFVIHVNELLSKGQLKKGIVEDIIKQKIMVPLVSENGKLVYKIKTSSLLSPTEKAERILRSDGEDSGLIFKGENIPIKIIDDSPTFINENSLELFLHPQIVVIIRENIENFLNSKLNEKFKYIP